MSLFSILCAKITERWRQIRNTTFVDMIFVRWNGLVRCFDVKKKSDGGIFYEHHDDQVKVSVFKLRLMIKALFFQSEDFRSYHAKE